MSILSLFELKGAQADAAEHLDVHLAVTAGAGSGKTRTLVARYLNFVETGLPLRSLIAITFTEKAAREMRSRIRQEIEHWLAVSAAPATGTSAEAEPWQQAFIELDAARIGTIHSLCADLLRLYPAEAGVDPRFTVLEEGRAAMWQAEAVESALAWAAVDPEAASLFTPFKESDLRSRLQALITRRLDLAALQFSDPLASWQAELQRWLDDRLRAPAWTESMVSLGEYASLREDDKLESARRAVLADWDEVQRARAAGDGDAALQALRDLRGAISTAGQARNWDATGLAAVREAMRTLRDAYDEALKPLLKDEVRWELDQQAAALMPALRRLMARVLDDYQALKDQSGALDFDDLEAGAVRLLTQTASSPVGSSALAAGPGQGLRAILVDEFQDTNDRQRQIVYALAGLAARLAGAEGGLAAGAASANLFIVGDAKQSIYRFRGADVTVFRRIQADLASLGGQVLNLDLTFRAHNPLLQTVQRLLGALMGSTDDPARPYQVPFAPLTAHRAQPREHVHAPFVEFIVGQGDAQSGRQAAAAALAVRLLELCQQDHFAWDEIALLFRASTAFPIYEEALEAAGIPFVTVAGKGFYDRPEIRDLLNALAAVADPTDDLALAGLLRSPAFGLSDGDLYHLRFPQGGDTPRPLYASLIADSRFSPVAQAITRLHTLAGRLPVAELLKRFLDLTHYRAILRASAGAGRLSRNVDKLLADAHRSRLVSVGDFLEYVQALRDVGAREGEAPAEVGGAVQLMTVHKAKGLEFPLVVIADAAYEHKGSTGEGVRLDPALGLLLKLTADKARPVAWQLGELADADREEAEGLRLLYVAATRAREKLLISGYAKISTAKSDPGRLLLSGWLEQLGSAIGLDSVRLDGDSLEAPLPLPLSPDWEACVTAVLHPLPAAGPGVKPVPAFSEPEVAPGPLVAPLTTFDHPPAPPLEDDEQVWRVVPAGRSAPAWVVGQLVHEALQRWTFPAKGITTSDFEMRLRPVAIRAGLVSQASLGPALREAARLLERLQSHPFFAEVEAALERHHAVPYVQGKDVDVIDLLFRTPDGWHIADFKTDELRDEAALHSVLPSYRARLRRQVEAVAAQFNPPARARAELVFLNLRGAVRVMPLEDS